MLELINKNLNEFSNLLLEKSGFSIINNEFSKTYIYTLSKKTVGFINYSIMYDKCELNYIYVDNDYRNKHIATKMLSFLIEESKRNKCANITLEVRIDNIPAMNLYNKFNFMNSSIRKKYYKDGKDAVLMIRKFD